MREKQFDDFFKEKLQNYEVAVPQGIFEKVIAHNKRKPVVSGVGFKMTIILFLTISSALTGGVFFVKSNNKNIHNHKKSTYQSQNTTTLLTHETVLNSQDKINTTNATTFAANTVTTNDNIAATILTTNNSKKNSNLKINSPYQNQSNNQNIFTLKNVESQSYAVKNDNTPIAENNFTAIENNVIEASNTTNTLYYKEQITPAFIKATTIYDWKNLQARQPLNTNKFKLHYSPDCPEVNEADRNTWYFETHVSPEYTFKQVSGANAAYLAKKDSVETMFGGVTLGIRARKNLTDNTFIKAGVQFSQLHEKLNILTESDRKTTTVVTIKTITDINGNVTTVTDTSTIVQITYKNTTSYNFYRNFELPVSVGYELRGKHFKTAFNGGLILNLASWYSGRTLNPNNDLISISNKNSNGVYKHTAGLSIFGSVSFAKPMNDFVDIFAEPYFRFNLTHAKATSLGYQQRFGAVGVGFGLRYKLARKTPHY
jgi:hypothetical protein